MNLFSKIRWIASVLLVFFIVLTTNLIDRDNFKRLSYSVTTMFEDRIVASDILFEISRIIQRIEIAILSSDDLVLKAEDSKLNKELDVFIQNYSDTKLTEEEKLVFNQLQEKIKYLIQQQDISSKTKKKEILKTIEEIDQLLYKLSKIQLKEGKREMTISNKAKETINLFTQVEIIFLIIMAILIQIIILYKPKEVN